MGTTVHRCGHCARVLLETRPYCDSFCAEQARPPRPILRLLLARARDRRPTHPNVAQLTGG